MNKLGAVFRTMVGLFVDDGAFALQIVAVIVFAALSVTLIPDVPLAAGAILLFGCLGALLASAITRRAA
jgi:hypothetical protein